MVGRIFYGEFLRDVFENVVDIKLYVVKDYGIVCYLFIFLGCDKYGINIFVFFFIILLLEF